jgi:hypothetical protein
MLCERRQEPPGLFAMYVCASSTVIFATMATPIRRPIHPARYQRKRSGRNRAIATGSAKRCRLVALGCPGAAKWSRARTRSRRRGRGPTRASFRAWYRRSRRRPGRPPASRYRSRPGSASKARRKFRRPPLAGPAVRVIVQRCRRLIVTVADRGRRRAAVRRR